MNQSITILALLAAMIPLACSGEAPESDFDSEDENLGEFSEALSANEDCDTATANKTTQTTPGNFTTGSTYGSSACAKAYLVDADYYIGRSDEDTPPFVHAFGYGDTVPTSKSECEKLRFGLYAWEKPASGSPSFVGSKWKWGVWASSRCTVPSIEPVNQFDLPYPDDSGTIRVYDDYRFAMSARRYATAKDSSSSYVTKRIRSQVTNFW